MEPSNNSRNKHLLPTEDADNGIEPKNSKITANGKKLQVNTYNFVASEMINAAKKFKNNRIPRGLMGEWLTSLHNSGYPNATRDILNKAIAKQKKEAVIAHNLAPVSTRQPCPPLFIDTPHSEISPLTENEGIDLTEHDSVEVSSCANKKTGRPKGTTDSAKTAEQDRKDQCMAEITSTYADKKLAKSEGCRVEKNCLSRLIQEKTEKYGLGDKVLINQETIKTRLRLRQFGVVKRPGLTTPLKKLEDLLVDILISASQFRKPLTVREGLELTNSLIKGSRFQQDVIDFQQKYCTGTMKKETEVGKLGMSYWNKFMHRHGQLIVSKRGERFASSHAQWSTYDNFADMYNKTYKEMCDAGLTKEMDPPVIWI